MFQVTQFCEPVSKYAKLPSQMYNQDAENIVEAEIANGYVIHTYYLHKELLLVIEILIPFVTVYEIYCKIRKDIFIYIFIQSREEGNI